jgi:hypothetical protein
MNQTNVKEEREAALPANDSAVISLIMCWFAILPSGFMFCSINHLVIDGAAS